MVPREVSQPFYNSQAWRKCRAAYIKSVGGLCERCLADGVIRQGYIVHHKQYITEQTINDPDVTLNWDNLEYLCFDCHQKEHFGSAEVLEQGYHFDSSGQLVYDAPRSNRVSATKEKRA